MAAVTQKRKKGTSPFDAPTSSNAAAETTLKSSKGSNPNRTAKDMKTKKSKPSKKKREESAKRIMTKAAAKRRKSEKAGRGDKRESLSSRNAGKKKKESAKISSKRKREKAEAEERYEKKRKRKSANDSNSEDENDADDATAKKRKTKRSSPTPSSWKPLNAENMLFFQQLVDRSLGLALSKSSNRNKEAAVEAMRTAQHRLHDTLTEVSTPRLPSLNRLSTNITQCERTLIGSATPFIEALTNNINAAEETLRLRKEELRALETNLDGVEKRRRELQRKNLHPLLKNVEKSEALKKGGEPWMTEESEARHQDTDDEDESVTVDSEELKIAETMKEKLDALEQFIRLTSKRRQQQAQRLAPILERLSDVHDVLDIAFLHDNDE